MASSTLPTKKVAVITGASSGIGRASAIALSEHGWAVAVLARRVDDLKETASLCANGGQDILVLAGNVTEEEFVKEAFEKTVERFGRLDVLFNNAGTGIPPNSVEDIPASAFTHTLMTNIVGPFLCTREAVRIFKSQDPQGGRIINNGSLSAHVPRPLSAAYTTSKHAITGLSKSTALDTRKYSVAVTQLDVGNAYTPMSARLATAALQADGSLIPEATFDVQLVAEAVVHISGMPASVSIPDYTIM